MINRTRQPDLNKIETLNIPLPEKARLDNGIPVFMFNAGDNAITKLDFIFDAGTRYGLHPLEVVFANKMLSEGTMNYSSYEIARKLDFYGAELNKAVTKDIAVLSLSALSKNMKYVLPILNEIINFPEFSADELKIHVQKDKQAFVDDCRKVSKVASMNFYRQLYGEKHPYGIIIAADDFDKLNPKQLVDFHREYYRPERCKIVVSGKLNPNILELLNYFFGHFRKEKPKIGEEIGHEIIQGKPKQFIKMPSAVQSAVRIGTISINKTHEDYIRLFILNTLFGGYFGSRLMKNIREDKGYTYGIYSMLLSFQKSAMFIISTEVGAQVCRKAVKEIYNELRILNNEPPSAQELDLVKKYLTGSIIRSFDGPFEVSDRFKSLLEYGIDYKKYYTEFIQTINTVRPDDLMNVANKYLDPESMSELIVGKK